MTARHAVPGPLSRNVARRRYLVGAVAGRCFDVGAQQSRPRTDEARHGSAQLARAIIPSAS